MNRLIHLAGFAICVGLALTCRAAPAPQPGVYETHGGWGTLTVTRPAIGTTRFAIESMGANGHSCSLDGEIRGTAGVTAAQGQPGACAIEFQVRDGAIEVRTDGGACHQYCGARASFNDTYWLPPPGCQPDQRKARRAAFLKAYRAKNYALAHTQLQPLLDQCAQFFHWIEIDQVRNDLGITLRHLGQSAQCRKVLGQNRAAAYANKEELRSSLSPVDFDNYLATAQATWHNLGLCTPGQGVSTDPNASPHPAITPGTGSSRARGRSD